MIGRAVAAFIRFYQRAISPLFPRSCRFHPTCSEYMLQAVTTHGVARGVVMGLRRIGRCHPWSDGGHDPVPDAPVRHARRVA